MSRSWAPSSDHLRVKVVDGVAMLSFDRPQVVNAMTREMLADLAAGLRWHGSGERSGAIVVTGTGRAFSSGDDLEVTSGLDEASFATLIDHFQDVTRAIFETKVPVVAALSGIAVGGAAEIAVACDVRVGGPPSDFLFPENGLGLTISNGSSLLLPALLGRAAIGVVLTGHRIPAQRALSLGLIDVWVDDAEEIRDRALALALEVAEEGRATPLHLEMLRHPIEDIERVLERERQAAVLAWGRGWPQQGMRRFRERPRTGGGMR